MNQFLSSPETQPESFTDDRQRIDFLNSLAAELSFSNPERSIELARQACQLARGGDAEPFYRAGLAAGLFNLARAHNQRGEYLESMTCLVEAQPHYEALNDENGLMWLFNEFGRLYFFFSDYPNALSYYHRTLQLAQKLGHTNRQAASYHNIGVLYSGLGQYKQALEAFQQGLEIAVRAGDAWVEGFLVGGMAEVFHHQKQYEQSLEYGLHSLELARRNGTPTLAGGVLLALSWTCFEMGQFEQAQSYLEEVIRTARASGDQRGLAGAQVALGKQANRRSLPEKAVPALQEALKLALALEEKALQADCHSALAESFRQLGRYEEAFAHFCQYHELDKTIFNEKSDLRLKMLQVVHELKNARQEAELYRLRAQMLQTEVDNQRQMQQVLQDLADRDSLSGLLNRRSFFRQGGRLLQSRRRSGFPLALLMLDLDHFKFINDHYGHVVGDNVLVGVATFLQEQARQADILCRYGGEEFAILLPGVTASRAEEIAWRLCHLLAERSFAIGETTIHITVSIGVALLERPGGSIEDLLRHADEALYQAKEAGRNCVRVYNG